MRNQFDHSIAIQRLVETLQDAIVRLRATRGSSDRCGAGSALEVGASTRFDAGRGRHRTHELTMGQVGTHGARCASQGV